MTLKEYTERAIQFAKDTKEWRHLDEFSHYTTGQWEDCEDFQATINRFS